MSLIRFVHLKKCFEGDRAGKMQKKRRTFQRPIRFDMIGLIRERGILSIRDLHLQRFASYSFHTVFLWR